MPRSSGWKFFGVILLLLMILAGIWILKTKENNPLPAPIPAPAPPIVEESKPTPPLMTAQKPMVVKKKTHAATTPKPRTPVATTVPVPVSVPTPVPAPQAVIPAPEAIAAPQEWQGNDTSVTHEGQVVIHNDHQWVHFWSEHHPHEAAPDVDFTNNMVVGVFAGPRPADQFQIKIVDVRNVSGALIVDYRERLPPTGTFAVNVTVYPYHLKIIPASTLPVKFKALEPENVAR